MVQYFHRWFKSLWEKLGFKFIYIIICLGQFRWNLKEISLLAISSIKLRNKHTLIVIVEVTIELRL